jgi:bacterioferritin
VARGVRLRGGGKTARARPAVATRAIGARRHRRPASLHLRIPMTRNPRQPFLTDMQKLRQRARRQMKDGAVTSNYGADAAQVCRVLNEALATEIVCVLRYKRHYCMASGIASESVKSEFLAHAAEEQAHADRIAGRIVQLGGQPGLDPASLAQRAHSQYVEGRTLRDMIQEDLVVERVAIESYGEIIAWLGGKDPSTRRMLEEILAVEEEHAEDKASLLAGLDR